MKITRDPTPKGNSSLKLTAYALAMNPNNVPILLERSQIKICVLLNVRYAQVPHRKRTANLKAY